MFDIILTSVIISTFSLRQYHPDMNKSPGAEEKFKEISAAYEVFIFLFHHHVVSAVIRSIHSIIDIILLDGRDSVYLVCFMRHTA